MTNHDDRMKSDVNATYGQMARGVIRYEDGITRLGQIADEHRSACKAELDAEHEKVLRAIRGTR